MHPDETILPDHICRGEEALVRQLVQQGDRASHIAEYWVRREREGFRRIARDRITPFSNDLMSEGDVNASVFLLCQPTAVGMLYRAVMSGLDSVSLFRGWHRRL